MAPVAAADSVGDLMVAWTDGRGTVPQIYAARVAVNAVVPVLVSFVRADATPESIHLTWFVSPAAGASVAMYRRTVQAPWSHLAVLAPDPEGRLTFDDHGVVPGERYGYRLGIRGSGGETAAGETWVDVPRELVFALRGVTPNPAADRLRASFTLATQGPASLELLDVSGRRLRSFEVGSLGPGAHDMEISIGRALAPGLYVVRLEQGGRSAWVKAMVVQ